MFVEFEPVVVILFIIAGISMLWIAKHLFGSYAAPVGIYGALWCFSLALFYLGITKFYPLELSTIFVFVGTIGLFLLGAIGAMGIAGRKGVPQFRMQTGRLRGSERLHQVVYVIFTIGVLGTGAYYQRLHQLIGIESLWLDPIKVRFEESMGILRQPGWIGLARSLLTPSFVLSIISLNLPQHKHRKYMWAVAITSFFLLLPSSGRTTIATMVIWAVIATIYLRKCLGKKNSMKEYGLWFLILPGLFVLYFLATTNLLQKALNREAGIVDIGLYNGSSFVAFQEMVRSPEQFATHASLTFGMASRVLHEIYPNKFTYPDYVHKPVYIPMATNVYTYLDAFFLDFGWIGVVIFPYFFGFLTTVVYFSMRKSPSVFKVYIASLLGQCIIQSTGVNRFGNLSTWVWILTPIVIINIITHFAPKTSNTKCLSQSTSENII